MIRLKKRLLYLSENHLSAWLWRGGKLSGSGVFSADKEGLANFNDWLALSPNTPIYLLVDVIAEEFHSETIPHILGKDRKVLISRKLNQLFRDTAYRHACPQGRETCGRRDDKLLVSGLSHADQIDPWVERILLLKQPLVGIWSLPLFSQMQAEALGLAAPHQLLVTWQAATGLRQSYFTQGRLKSSRLTLPTADDFTSMQEIISRETARTRQYLNSLHLLPANVPLDIAVCGANQPLQVESMNTPLLRYQVFSLEEIIERFGFKAPVVDLSGEMLYLHLLGRHAPPQHYATPEQLWYRRLQRVRAGILGVTALLLAVAGFVAGQNFEDAFDDYRESEKISRETHNYFSQYQAVKNTFPPTPATPEAMKGAVELMQAVYDKNVKPERLMVLVSRALETSGSLKLNRIKWQVSDSPEKTEDSLCPLSPILCPLTMGKPHQIAIIDGEIIPFSNYRYALDDINRFIETLNKNPSLRATALSMPLDINSSASLQGGMGTLEKTVFSLKVVFSPAP